MRFSPWIPSFALFGLVAVACSSSSSGPSTPSGPVDGGGGSDGPAADVTAMDQAAPSCGNIAACYSVSVTVSPSSPAATCGSGTLPPEVADYTDIPPAGGTFTTSSGCTGQISGCNMTLRCPTGYDWTFLFGDQGFTAMVSLTNAQGVTCEGGAVGTRLAACPVSTDDGGAGDDGAAPPGDSGSADAALDVSTSGTDSAAADAAVEAEAGSVPEGGAAEASTTEAGSDAGSDGQAPEAGNDASADASGDDGALGDAMENEATGD
jgi:hypothetical protein